MALKATIFKAELAVSDIDRGVYGTHTLTIARHPSETDERMMVRVLAFALNADERLDFGKGISNENEPALWRRDLTGAVEQWMEVGLPEERTLRRACGKASEVRLYTYGGRGVDVWWQANGRDLNKLDRLSVFDVPLEATRELALMAARTMTLNVTIQEGQVFFSDEARVVTIELRPLKAVASVA
ncbi:MAG: YaeQ family protein [Rhodocyclaceae bacterium]|nr:YaeQ family protein [Rhodocyclaceae bacterium]